MTCREKLIQEHPEHNNELCFGGCSGCPSQFGYANRPDWCRIGFETCAKCWDREVCEKMFYVVINENGMYWSRNGEWETGLNKAVFYSNLEYAKKTAKRFARWNTKVYSVTIEIEHEVNG